MGSIVVLSPREQEPFRRGLKRLHRIIMNPDNFIRLMRLGVSRVFALGGVWRLYPEMFRWMTFPHAGIPKTFPGDVRFVYEPERGAEKYRQMLGQELSLLQLALHDRETRGRLAEIGVTKFSLTCAEDVEIFNEYGPEILLGNYIAPDVIPNNDWGLRLIDGRPDIYYHS